MEITLVGKVSTEPIIAKSYLKCDIYECNVENVRLSGKVDTIRLTYSGVELHKGDLIFIKNGAVRCIKADIYVHTSKIKVLEKIVDNTNIVSGVGTIMKPIVYRKTANGMEVADMLIECKDKARDSKLYCSIWGKNVEKVKEYKVGDSVRIVGRLQSQLKDMGFSTEISVFRIQLM